MTTGVPGEGRRAAVLGASGNRDVAGVYARDCRRPVRQRLRVVGQAGFIGRADLDETGATLVHDRRDAEATGCQVLSGVGS